MLRLRTSRPLATIALASGLFLVQTGCGGDPKPGSDKSEKKSETTPSPTPGTSSIPANIPNTDANGNPQLTPQSPTIDHNSGVGKLAADFVTALRSGGVKAEMLSTRFAKAIGLPALLPDDKAKGYSSDAAEGWLRRVGSAHSLSPLLEAKQVGDVALFRGIFGDGPGTYTLRMVLENGAWKVDWVSITSATIKGAELKTLSGDAACQEFAVIAVVGELCDRDALSKEDRAVALAAGLTPALKARWAEPFGSDKGEGLDYNRGLLAQKAAEFGKDVESFSVTAAPNSTDYQIEVCRTNGSKSTYLVKLAKGPGPCFWLVDDVVNTKLP